MTGRVRRTLAAMRATSVPRLRRDAALVLVLAAATGGLAAYSQASFRAGLESVDRGAVEAVASAGSEADVVIRAPVGPPLQDGDAEERFTPAQFLSRAKTWPADLPPLLRERVTSPTSVLVAPSLDSAARGGAPALSVTLAVPDRRLAQRLEPVQGRRAGDAAGVVELLVPRSAAATAGLRVGSTVVLEPFSRVLDERPVQARVAGLVDPPAAVRDALEADLPDLARATPLVASGRPAGYGVTAFTTGQGLERASAALRQVFTGVVRLPAVPARFDAAAVSAFDGGVREAASASSSWADQAAPVSVQSGFGVALSAFPASAAAAAGQQRTAIAGALAVGLVALLLLAAALGAARRGSVGLERVRGLTVGGIAARSTLESLLVAAPAVAIGAAAAGLVVPGPVQPLPLAVLLVVAVVAPAAAEARGAAPAARGARAAVADAAVVGVAAAALLVLRGGSTGSADPLLVVAPALCALGVAVLVRRLGAVVALAARPLLLRGRGATAALTAARVPGAGSGLLVTAVAVATGVAVGGAVLLGDLDAGRTAASWRQAGADVRVTGALPEGAAARAAAAEGVTEVAAAGLDRTALLVVGDADSSVGLLGVDRAWTALLAATPGAPPPDAALLTRLRTDPADPLPVLVSPLLADRVGSDGALLVDGRRTDVRVIGVARSWPADDLGRAGVLADASRLASAQGRQDERDLLLVDGPGAAAATRDLGGTRLVRSSLVATARDRALPAGVAAAVRGSSTAATLLALLALAGWLRATAPARRRESALLGVLGLPAGAPQRLLVARLAPVVLLAVLGGAVGGVLSIRALAPALGVDQLAGVPAGAGPVLPVVALAAAVAGLAVVAAALLGARRRDAPAITALSTEGDAT